jgi:hypothetical protein
MLDDAPDLCMALEEELAKADAGERLIYALADT